MPFISIIIPTHNNEEHIEQAILSCFDSDFDDFEIIVINDASTDKTEDKIRSLQNQFSEKIKIILSEQQIGPGPARNLGLEKVNGEYIMFLDGDDWFEPNAINVVAKKLYEIQPDVLMFNHQRVWEDGTKTPNIPNRYVGLDGNDKNLSHPKDRTAGIRNIYVPWNKAYKKTFIKKENLKFPAGYYEDIFWSVYSITNANTVFYTGKIITNYRQRACSITRSTNEQHIDLIQQYYKTKSFLNNSKAHKKNYGVQIYKSAKAQILGVLQVGYRLPKHLEKEFMLSSYLLLKAWKKELKIRSFDLNLLSLATGNIFLFNTAQYISKKAKKTTNTKNIKNRK